MKKNAYFDDEGQFDVQQPVSKDQGFNFFRGSLFGAHQMVDNILHQAPNPELKLCLLCLNYSTAVKLTDTTAVQQPYYGVLSKFIIKFMVCTR